jgi:hypothetical protein
VQHAFGKIAGTCPAFAHGCRGAQATLQGFTALFCLIW